MNKGELIEALGEELKESKAGAERILNTVLEKIVKAVQNEGTLQIAGFGTFTKKNRAARAGRNPQTGETIQIAASTTVGFKPAKQFKESL